MRRGIHGSTVHTGHRIFPEYTTVEKLEHERDKYKYYLPVLNDGQVLGNLVITIDFNRYFSRVFAKYNLEQYQWQWMVNDTGMIVYDNHGGEVAYSELRKIQAQLEEGHCGLDLPQDGDRRESPTKLFLPFTRSTCSGSISAWYSLLPQTFSRSTSSGMRS